MKQIKITRLQINHFDLSSKIISFYSNYIKL
jgi:hypothetical protein